MNSILPRGCSSLYSLHEKSTESIQSSTSLQALAGLRCRHTTSQNTLGAGCGKGVDEVVLVVSGLIVSGVCEIVVAGAAAGVAAGAALDVETFVGFQVASQLLEDVSNRVSGS